jgi:hypothetical protein
LLEAKAMEPGTELCLNLGQFSREERAVIEPTIQGDPEVGLAEWTGQGLRKALRWRADGRVCSATGLVKRILNLQGYEVHKLAGPRYWKVPEGQTLSRMANTLDQGLQGEET